IQSAFNAQCSLRRRNSFKKYFKFRRYTAFTKSDSFRFSNPRHPSRRNRHALSYRLFFRSGRTRCNFDRFSANEGKADWYFGGSTSCFGGRNFVFGKRGISALENQRKENRKEFRGIKCRSQQPVHHSPAVNCA